MKILIFYASYGGGHLSAAKSIEEYIKENYKSEKIETELIDCIKYVNKNIESTKFKDKAQVFNSTAERFLASYNGDFDIAFLDPPYKKGILQKSLKLVAKSVKKTGIIICENPCDEELEEHIESFAMSKQYKYGKIKISVYKSAMKED